MTRYHQVPLIGEDGDRRDTMSAHVLSTIGVVLHWSMAIVLSLRVIVRRLPTGIAMAWLVVICAVPFVGSVLYLLFGEKRLGRGRQARISKAFVGIQKWRTQVRDREPRAPSADSRRAPLDRHAERVTGLPALEANQITLLHDFEAVFDALIADIDAAQDSCLVGYYIWNEGGRANDVFDALERAAQRGVTCRAMADGLGSKAFLKGRRVKQMRKAGVEVVTALPTGLIRSLFVRADLRNHRKIVVIDDKVAYTGSQNLVDPRYFKQNAGVGQWVDAVARMCGPSVSSLAAVFRSDWSVETGREFEPPGLSPPAPPNGHLSVVQVLPSGPGRRPEAIQQILLEGIYAARRELVLTTPYFVPDDSMLTAILSAALRGVEVTLLVPKRNDSIMVRYASESTYADLMDAGVRIALFKDGLLHTKSITIDREMSIFGSVNLDMRSLWINFEISLLVYDAGFTERLRKVQQGYVDSSDMLDPDEWSKRPLRHWFVEDTLRLLGPLL